MKEIDVPRDTFACCKNCGSSLVPSEVDGYTYSCTKCDEDFYEFEAIRKDVEPDLECAWTIEFAWLPKRTFENKFFWFLPYVDIMTKSGMEIIDTFRERDGETVAIEATRKMNTLFSAIAEKDIVKKLSKDLLKLNDDRVNHYAVSDEIPTGLEMEIRDTGYELATLVLRSYEYDL